MYITTTTVQPTAVCQQVVLGRYSPWFSRSVSLRLGGLQILMAFTSWAAATWAIFVYAANYYICDGYWCGIFFLFSGISAIHAGRLPTDKRIKSALWSSILALLFAATQFGLSLWGLIVNIYNPVSTYLCWWWYWYIDCTPNYQMMEAANGLLVAAAGLEMLLCLGEIASCAKAIKRGKNHPMVVEGNDLVIVEERGRRQHHHPRPIPFVTTKNNATVTVITTSQTAPQQPSYQQQPPPTVYVNEGYQPPPYSADFSGIKY